MYLFLIIDWYSRKVIDYKLSSTLEKGFVLKCLKRAFSHCKPEIMNSDQGSHFTNSDYLELLEKAGVKPSMDGKVGQQTTAEPSGSSARSSTNASTSTNSKTLVRCAKG